MNYMANLKQALDFYRRNGGRSRGLAPGESGEIMPGMLWAERIADRMGGGGGGVDQGPDFFADDRAPAPRALEYTRPDDSGAPPLEMMAAKRSTRPRVGNYFAQLMMKGGRGGY